MTTALDRVLVPVDVSEPRSLDGTLVDTLPSASAVVLGYWPTPDQAAPTQVRRQFEGEARERLDSVAGRFTNQKTAVQTELVFTRDRDRLIDRATNEYDCQSVLIPGTESPPAETTRGIVLVKPDADLDRVVATCGSLFAESDVELSLFHVAGSGDKHLHDATEYMLRGMVAQLGEHGIDGERVTWEQSTNPDRVAAILSQVADYDFVVLSETKPSLRERIFGRVQSKLAEETGKPLLTVRTSK